MKVPAILLILLCLALPARAQLTTSLSITGTSWSVNPLTSSIVNAGRDYTHIETSAANQTLINAGAVLGWSVSVQFSATGSWDPLLKLYVTRTGDGTGTVSLTGGTTPIQVTNVSQRFFSSSLNVASTRNSVPIQYKIEGLSVMLPVKTYTATVLYTISGL